jgi:hypothetical protein
VAIFDSKKTTYLTFYIVLTDPAEVAALTAQYPDGVNRAPEAAGVEFGAPWQGYDVPVISPPFSYTVWRGDDADRPFPTDVATFQRHTGGFFGIGGTTIRYYWMGKFMLQAPHDPTSGGGGAVTATTKRRWIEGFELPNRTVNGGSTHSTYFSTDASRHTGGRGFAFRGLTNSSMTYPLNLYDATFVSPITQTWERMYLRLRKAPATSVVFWRNSYSGGGSSHALGVGTSGQLALYSIDAANTITFLTALPDSTLEVWNGHADTDVWRRIDMLIDLTAGSFKFYVDGVLRYNGSGLTGTSHVSSSMGAPVNQGANDLELDVDDWMCANFPAAQNGLDWTNGSKIVQVRPRQFNGNHSVNWTGDVRTLLQQADSLATPTEVTSGTSGAVLAVDTDGDEIIATDPESIGAAAFTVQVVGRKTAGGDVDPSIGYKIGGAAAVVTQRVMQAAYGGIGIGTIFSSQAGSAAALPAVTPLELRVVKGADANTTRLVALSAQVELLGKFSAADYTEDEAGDLGDALPQSESMGPHNYSYPRSPWARRGLAPPISPFLISSGTYVGNGTGQDLTFAVPIHFLFIRPLTGNSGGGIWLQHGYSSHASFVRGSDPNNLVTFEEDPSFVAGTGEDAQQQRYRVRIAGAHSQTNQNAVTYQYVAVGDPGMRFLLGGAILHKTNMGDVANNLLMSDFSPEFLLATLEIAGAVATKGFYGKASAQSAAEILVPFENVAAVASALSMGAGVITTKNALYALQGGASFTYLGIRRDDGSGDTGLPGVVAVGSYTGDGAGSRTIAFPTSGKRPLFAMVFSEAAAHGYWRDPSHTGTNSSQSNGTDTATGITAGAIDSMTVGSSLNTNAVVYSYFVLFSCDVAAGNNGWGTNVAACYPVEAVHPGGGTGGWPPVPPEPEPEEPDVDVPGGGFAGGPPLTPPDFSAACYLWSGYMCNIALQRIGISHQIADIRTEATEEAYKARLVYAMTVEAVLRDYPWPFATRYANLSLVAGSEASPVNKDWTYSYRQPVDMITARRLISQDGHKRHFDQKPPEFRLGSDETGYLIYSNASSSSDRPVQLEYTYRMQCPAQQGDPLFRDALAWKLASVFALSLGRDRDKAKDCEAMYRSVLPAAKEVAANEAQPDNEGDAPWISGR